MGCWPRIPETQSLQICVLKKGVIGMEGRAKKDLLQILPATAIKFQ